MFQNMQPNMQQGGMQGMMGGNMMGMSGGNTCRNWSQFRCTYGDKCKYLHMGPGACVSQNQMPNQMQSQMPNQMMNQQSMGMMTSMMPANNFTQPTVTAGMSGMSGMAAGGFAAATMTQDATQVGMVKLQQAPNRFVAVAVEKELACEFNQLAELLSADSKYNDEPVRVNVIKNHLNEFMEELQCKGYTAKGDQNKESADKKDLEQVKQMLLNLTAGQVTTEPQSERRRKLPRTSDVSVFGGVPRRLSEGQSSVASALRSSIPMLPNNGMVAALLGTPNVHHQPEPEAPIISKIDKVYDAAVQAQMATSVVRDADCVQWSDEDPPPGVFAEIRGDFDMVTSKPVVFAQVTSIEAFLNEQSDEIINMVCATLPGTFKVLAGSKKPASRITFLIGSYGYQYTVAGNQQNAKVMLTILYCRKKSNQTFMGSHCAMIMQSVKVPANVPIEEGMEL